MRSERHVFSSFIFIVLHSKFLEKKTLVFLPTEQKFMTKIALKQNKVQACIFFSSLENEC